MIKMASKKENLVVMKFGGSCLQDAKSFEQTTNNINLYYRFPRDGLFTIWLEGLPSKYLLTLKHAFTIVVRTTGLGLSKRW